MLKRSLFALLSSCLVLAVGCGSSGTDPGVSGIGGTTGNGGTTASGTGGASTNQGGSTNTTSTGGVSNNNGGSTSSSTGGSTPGTGGATSQGGGSVGGASKGGAATGGAATVGGATAGGSTATGGKAATGGAATVGGATAGGSTATGGKAATGGAATVGGATAGGSTATGGTTTTSTGGVTAAGGTTADTSGCRVWLATDGNDSNAGTAAAPVATLLHAYDLLCPMVSGSAAGAECSGASPRTLCVKAGTYTMTTRFEFKKTRMGTSSNRIIVQADPSATTKPVFDFSTQPRVECQANPSDGNLGGFTINADYVTVKNLEIKGANDNCIKAQGANGRIEGVVAHGCADAGVQISAGSGYTGSGTNNAVVNCDSYQNNDTQCNGENADGFAVKEATGAGNSFSGCRSWDNADDGWDLYGFGTSVRIENSWAFNQCATTLGSASDCNGFKLGGDGVSAAHVLVGLVSVGNSRATGNGFTENSNPASMSCTGSCYSWGNKVNVDSIGGSISTTAVSGVTVTSMAAASARNADGSLKAITAL